MKKPSLAQTFIPLPSGEGKRLSPEELFAQEYGAEKLAEQKRLYEEERACTCTSEFPEKWGTKYGHEQGCPRARGRF